MNTLINNHFVSMFPLCQEPEMATCKEREQVFDAIKKVLETEKFIGQELSGPSLLSFLVQALSITTESICVIFESCQ